MLKENCTNVIIQGKILESLKIKNNIYHTRILIGENQIQILYLNEQLELGNIYKIEGKLNPRISPNLEITKIN